MSYIKDIIIKYPIRRSRGQKQKFRDYVCNEANTLKQDIKIENLENKHDNILIGDVDNAKVVFTAHYDTPAASLFPNIMMPRNVVLGMIYQFSYPILLALLSLGVSYLIANLLNFQYEIWAVLYIVLYLGSFYLCTRCFDNKNNYNDNTSGVAAVLELARKCSRNDIAFILFDNEEKGKLGSKAFSKAHNKSFIDKLVINLDCVGNGNNILFVAKDKALDNPYYKTISNFVKNNEAYNVEFYGMKGSISNSDYKNFEGGVSVMACKKGRYVGYYTPRIHTKFDTIYSEENIEFIVGSFNQFIENI